MPDYTKGKIYKILNTVDEEIYVGSTIEPLSMRMAKHRAKATHKPLSQYLFSHMIKHGYDKFYIELIENYPCNGKEELRAKEGEWIRKIGTLNQIIAGRSCKQYKEDNKTEIKQKEREYREKHVEHYRQLKQEYIANNEENIKQYNKNYYEKNKDRLNEKITCACGAIHVKQYTAQHLRTKKHINFINNNINKDGGEAENNQRNLPQ